MTAITIAAFLLPLEDEFEIDEFLLWAHDYGLPTGGGGYKKGGQYYWMLKPLPWQIVIYQGPYLTTRVTARLGQWIVKMGDIWCVVDNREEER